MMRTLIGCLFVAGFLALAVGHPAAAESSLRCNGGLVRLGDGTWQVERACGEPDYQYHQGAVDIPDVGVIGPVDPPCARHQTEIIARGTGCRPQPHPDLVIQQG